MAAIFNVPHYEVQRKQEEEEDHEDNLISEFISPYPETTKSDIEIAKYVRFKAPRKSTMMQKQAVEYFVGSKAVDALMESKWATGKKGVKQLFTSREDAANFMDDLLQKKFFYRVDKVEKELKNKDNEKGDESGKGSKDEKAEDAKSEEKAKTKLRRRKKGKEADEDQEINEETKSNKAKGKTKGKGALKEKKPKEKVKKRYKLVVHDEQIFLDSKDIYIWLYNPVGWKTIIMGMGVLLCVVAATLFPLWPPEVRVGVYYISLAGGVFIGIIFATAIARSILYGLIWIFTGGKHHLWILPNILADVGFFDSFKPLYTHEYRGSKEDDEDAQKEEEDEEENEEDSKEEGDNEEKKMTESQDEEKNSQTENSTDASESESAAS